MAVHPQGLVSPAGTRSSRHTIDNSSSERQIEEEWDLRSQFVIFKKVARKGPKDEEDLSYLVRLSSLPSGGRTTKRPSKGMALSSMLKPRHSLWGSAARNLCLREKKPRIALDAGRLTALGLRLLEEQAIEVLNVAGPRASAWPQGDGFTLRVIGELISRM
jgi:hypothetical protein